MSHGIQNLIDRTRALAGLAKARGLSDRQLLDRFADGDEAAFSALVERHGGLVMGVCRRVLQHTQDAEDAFQATFMVLARKAGKIDWHDSVGNWLHGVAYRVASQVRRETARLRTQELGQHEPASPSADPAWSEVKPVLDEELNRLPARYRIPLILCCLEGKSRDEAASQLGWSVGSVKGRLERGREILRSRLAKRGLALSAVLGATLLIVPNASAAVPLTLGLATVRAGMSMLAGQTAGVVSTQVLSLTQGVIHAMLITKLKYAAAVLLAVGVLSLGTGYVTQRVLATGAAAPTNPGADSYAFLFAEEFPEYTAQREQRKEQPTVSGMVQEVDVKKGTINILVSRADTAGQTYELSKDAKVVIREGREAKSAKLEDVKQKARVVMTLNADKVVLNIDVLVAIEGGERGRRDPHIVIGIVGEVDAAKNQLTLLVGGGREAAPTKTTYDVAKDAKITVREGRDVKPIALKDLQAKARVLVTLDAGKKVIQTIEAAVAGGREGDRGRGDGGAVFGVLTEVDAAKSTITLQSGGREAAVKMTTYELAKDVKVIFRTGRITKEGKLADLELKKPVQIRLDEEKKKVQTIEVIISTRAAGAVSEVNPATNSISIDTAGGRGEDAKIETYVLSKDVKVIYHLPGVGAATERGRGTLAKEAQLTDLVAKTSVALQLDDDRKIVQSIEVNLATMRGELQSVDAVKGTLLLRGVRGGDMDLGIAKDAKVMVDGKEAKVADLAVGREALVTLSPDRTKVLVIQSPPPEGR